MLCWYFAVACLVVGIHFGGGSHSIIQWISDQLTCKEGPQSDLSLSSGCLDTWTYGLVPVCGLIDYHPQRRDTCCVCLVSSKVLHFAYWGTIWKWYSSNNRKTTCHIFIYLAIYGYSCALNNVKYNLRTTFYKCHITYILPKWFQL